MKKQNQVLSPEARGAVSLSKTSPKPKLLRYLLLLLGLAALILIGGGAYYLYLTKPEVFGLEETVEPQSNLFLTDGRNILTPPEADDPSLKTAEIGYLGAMSYRRGPDTYYRSNDSDQLVLLSVQGLVTEIDYEKKFFYLESEGIKRKLDLSVREVPIYLVEYRPLEGYNDSESYVPRMRRTLASFEAISVGDEVTYNVPDEFNPVGRLLVVEK